MIDQRFIRRWNILEMEVWDKDCLDLVVPAFIQFDDDGMGEFRFGTVRSFMDCRYLAQAGRPLVEFSWQGISDTDDANGRGWAYVETDGTMTGHLYIHASDDSAFRAVKLSDRVYLA